MAISTIKKSLAIQLLPVAIFLLLSISLYLPQLLPTSSLIGMRSQITSISICITLIILSFLIRDSFAFISPQKILAAFIFPSYLLLHGIIEGNLGIAFFGNSDRSLGVVTYFSCGCFFLLGSALKSILPEGLSRIILLLGSLQLISLSTSYFGITNDRRLGSFFNSNPNGILSGLIFVLVLVWITESKKKSRFIAVTVVSLLCAWTLFWIGAKQSIVGFVVTLLAFGIFKAFKDTLKIANLFLLTIITTFFSFFTYIYFADTPSADQSNSNSFDERLDIYKTSLKVISDEFLLGIGVDQFNLGYYRSNAYENLKLVDNAHSIPLQLFSTLGIIGFLLFFGIIYHSVRQANSYPDKFDTPIIFALIYYVVSGLFAIQNPGIESIIFFILGFLANRQNPNLKSSNKPSVSFIRVMSLLVVVSVSISIFGQLQTSRALAGKFLPLAENNLQIRVNTERVYDIGLLLKAGEYSIIVSDKELGLALLERMMKISPMDQRTIALALLLAESFEDESLFEIAFQLNEMARK